MCFYAIYNFTIPTYYTFNLKNYKNAAVIMVKNKII